MNRLRLLLIAAGVAVVWLAVIQPVQATISTLASQIGISIVVNVTPSPLAYAPHQAPSEDTPGKIAVRVSLQRETPSLKRVFEAQSLRFGKESTIVLAQAQVQKPLLVQAEVSPNPNATLLYSTDPSGNPIGSVQVNATAGTTVQVPCAFQVRVMTTKAWSLEQGLSNDFASGFPGKDLANNTYISTPKPTSTPYVVYADDGSSWSVTGSGSGSAIYCITLTLTVPGTVTAGTYSSNAIYTLYYSS